MGIFHFFSQFNLCLTFLMFIYLLNLMSICQLFTFRFYELPFMTDINAKLQEMLLLNSKLLFLKQGSGAFQA